MLLTDGEHLPQLRIPQQPDVWTDRNTNQRMIFLAPQSNRGQPIDLLDTWEWIGSTTSDRDLLVAEQCFDTLRFSVN